MDDRTAEAIREERIKAAREALLLRTRTAD